MSQSDRTLLGIIVVLIAVSLVWQAICALFRAIKFARDQVRDRFWRETDKLTLFITLLLLFVGYAFYSHDQPRTFVQAVEDIGLQRLAELLPITILTGWVLLVVFWFLFCGVMGVPSVAGDAHRPPEQAGGDLGGLAELGAFEAGSSRLAGLLGGRPVEGGVAGQAGGPGDLAGQVRAVERLMPTSSRVLGWPDYPR